MGHHLNAQGQFQSDRHPQLPPGKFALSLRDPMAQDLIAEYARRCSKTDPELSEDLRVALQGAGYFTRVLAKAEHPGTHEAAMDIIASAAIQHKMTHEEAIAIYLRVRGILRDRASPLGAPIPPGWQPPVEIDMTPEQVEKLLNQLSYLRGPDHTALLGIEAAKIIRNLAAKVMSGDTEQRVASAIAIEKELCDALGRQWTPTGFSVATLVKDTIELLKKLRASLRWFQYAHAWAGAEAWDGTSEMRQRFDHAAALARMVQDPPNQEQMAEMGDRFADKPRTFAPGQYEMCSCTDGHLGEHSEECPLHPDYPS